MIFRSVLLSTLLLLCTPAFAQVTFPPTGGPGLPSGGETGQVLKKNSDNEGDFSWLNDSIGGSGAGVHTEIPCVGNITTPLLAALNAREHVIVGPGDCTITSPFAPTDSVIEWHGSGIRETSITFTDPADGRCGFERLPSTGSGLSQGHISKMRWTMTGSTNAIACFAGISNGSIVEQLDLRGGNKGLYITNAPADNSVCFRCEIKDIFSFNIPGPLLHFDGDNVPAFGGLSALFARIINVDARTANPPMIIFQDIRDEESHLYMEQVRVGLDEAFDGDPAIQFINVGDLPVMFMSGHGYTTTGDFFQANSNIALTSFGFNARNLQGGSPNVSCDQFIDYISPATATDVPCNSNPGMSGSNLGRPAVINGTSWVP